MGASAVGLGIASFGASIRRPIEVQIASAPAGYLTPSEREAKEEAELRLRDTDADGLSDYDEQKLYRTSAYLKDSDSDGIDDRTEVLAGGNPNCPVGKDCGGLADAQAQGGPLIATPEPPVPPASLTAPAQQEPQSPEELKAYFASLSINEIRSALLTAGLPSDLLAGLKDDELRALFDKTVEESIASGQFNELLAEEETNP